MHTSAATARTLCTRTLASAKITLRVLILITLPEQVLDRVQKELSTTTQYGAACGGSRLMEAATDRRALAKALPDILCYAPDDVKERKRS